ncbi:MAG TPA: efflux RND transporter periplasmic adaptor subunit, partial [Polyangia bacterium]
PKRDYLEKQLVLRRMKVDLEKAEEALQLAQRSAQTDLDVKRISIEKLRRAMTDAEHAVTLLTLRAPAAGTVIVAEHPEERRKLQEGDDVFMGMTVVRVTNSNARRVRAQLLDVDDGKIAAGMPARVVLDAYPDRSFSAAIRDIASMARTPDNSRGAQRRIFAVNVDLNDAEAAVLRPGLSARVEVQVERRTNVLLAPRTAIDWIDGEARARVTGKGLVPVKIGGCNRDVCVIEDGLAEGTSVGGVSS